MQPRYFALVVHDPTTIEMQAQRISARMTGQVTKVGDRVVIWTDEDTPVRYIGSHNSLLVGIIHPRVESYDADPTIPDLDAVSTPSDLVSRF